MAMCKQIDVVLPCKNDSFACYFKSEGEEHEFLLIDMLEVEEKQYAVLSPIEDNEESDDAIILRWKMSSHTFGIKKQRFSSI